RFLLHFLKSSAGLQHIAHRSVGAVRFMLRFGDLEQIELPLPPPVEQERIVSILEEAKALRQLRAQAIERTLAVDAALLQDILGVPSTNPFGWEMESVGNLFDKKRGGVKCGPFGSALKKNEYTDTGVPVWGIPNVLANQFVETGSLFI